MKKNVTGFFRYIGMKRKLLLKMKLTLIGLFLCFMQVSATVYSQATKFTFEIKQQQVANVLREIEEESNFRFFYQREQVDVERVISLNSNENTVEEILSAIFKDQGVKYKVLENDLILLTPEENKFSELMNASQQNSISGTVTDEASEPLPGVTVLIKGTTNGTVTNMDGNYAISNIPDGATLVFSFIGMLTQEIEVGSQTAINITMKTDAIGIEEVVAIGYGTARRKDISGAVSTLRMEDSPIANLPASNALQSLQGTIAGVNVGTQNSPGSTPSIEVRGQNSIKGDNAPLIVLDGIVYLGSMADINPDDIAVMDVLKDASAAAVYGSRAANGVVVITTKRGKTDKPVITFNSSMGLNTWPDKPNMMDFDRWTEKYIAQEPAVNSAEDIIHSQPNMTHLYAQRINTDWIDFVSRNGFFQNHQVSVSGNSEKINYYFSGGYNNSEGTIIGDDYERISVRSKLDAKVTDWLEVGIDGTYNKNDYSGISANLHTVYHLPPFAYPYRWEEMPYNVELNTGTLLEKHPRGAGDVNPLWGTDGTVDDIDKRNFFRFATYALFKVPKVDGLTYRLNFSINSNFNIRERFYYEEYYVGEQLQEPYIDRYTPTEYAKFLSQANGYNQRTNSYSYVLDNIVNYKKQFGDHYLDATMVATRDYSYYKLVQASGSDYSLNGNTLLGTDGIHKAALPKNNLNVIEKANIGYLGRISYAYQDKYHLTASMRRDGASVFGEDKKWGNFPSLGVAWTASKENFISDFDKLSYLKIKASFGKNGNQGLSPYQTLAKVTSGSDGGIRYEFADAPTDILYGVAQSNLGSSTLGWEATTAFNGGFQSAWLNNRIFLDLDFYFSKTTDQIFSRQIPIMTGFSSIYSSIGQVDNKGIEVSLRTVNINNADFKWTSNLIFWQNRNKIASLYGDDIDGDGIEDDDISNSYFIGKSLGAIYGYEYIGVVQEDDTEYIENVGVSPGDAMFRDISGPDGVPDGIITADYDRKILGFRKENFKLSLANTVEYKNLSLYVLVTGIFGGGKDNYFLKENPYHNSFWEEGNYYNDIDHDWWTPENKSEEYLSPTFNGNRYLGLQSRGFVKIQDINLSYKLPKSILKPISANSMEIYGSIKNAYTFTNWSGGGDPEAAIAIKSTSYPTPRVFSMGLRVNF